MKLGNISFFTLLLELSVPQVDILTLPLFFLKGK